MSYIFKIPISYLSRLNGIDMLLLAAGVLEKRDALINMQVGVAGNLPEGQNMEVVMLKSHMEVRVRVPWELFQRNDDDEEEAESMEDMEDSDIESEASRQQNDEGDEMGEEESEYTEEGNEGSGLSEEEEDASEEKDQGWEAQSQQRMESDGETGDSDVEFLYEVQRQGEPQILGTSSSSSYPSPCTTWETMRWTTDGASVSTAAAFGVGGMWSSPVPIQHGWRNDKSLIHLRNERLRRQRIRESCQALAEILKEDGHVGERHSIPTVLKASVQYIDSLTKQSDCLEREKGKQEQIRVFLEEQLKNELEYAKLYIRHSS